MRPGGAYVHISRTFNNYYLGFIAVWMKLMAFVGAITFMASSFGDYMTFFIPDTDVKMWASGVIIFFFAINIIGIRYYAQIQTGMLIILIGSILVLIIPGLFVVELSNYCLLYTSPSTRDLSTAPMPSSA